MGSTSPSTRDPSPTTCYYLASPSLVGSRKSRSSNSCCPARWTSTRSDRASDCGSRSPWVLRHPRGDEGENKDRGVIGGSDLLGALSGPRKCRRPAQDGECGPPRLERLSPVRSVPV